MGNWLGAEELDDESPGCVVPNQIVVKLQYSHNNGDVSESNLQTLLDALSKAVSEQHSAIYTVCIGLACLNYKQKLLCIMVVGEKLL